MAEYGSQKGNLWKLCIRNSTSISLPELSSQGPRHTGDIEIASRILEMKNLGQVDAAELELAQNALRARYAIEPLSENIVNLLNSVEEKVREKLPRSNG